VLPRDRPTVRAVVAFSQSCIQSSAWPVNYPSAAERVFFRTFGRLVVHGFTETQNRCWFAPISITYLSPTLGLTLGHCVPAGSLQRPHPKRIDRECEDRFLCPIPTTYSKAALGPTLERGSFATSPRHSPLPDHLEAQREHQ